MKTKTRLNKSRKMQIIAILSLSLALGLNLSSCKKKDNEEELITTVSLKYKDPISMLDKVYTWKDLDGDGGVAPTPADTLFLDSGQVYQISLELKNQANGGDVDITKEVETEGKDHFVCYNPVGTGAMIIDLVDSDGTYPIGLKCTWRCTKRGSGIMRVQLKHQPNVKNGTCDPGDTDVDVNFSWKIR